MAKREHRQEPIGLDIWFGVFAGPAAWVTQLSLVYFLVTWACIGDLQNTKLWVHVVSAVALLVDGVAGTVAWRNWQESRSGPLLSAVKHSTRSRPFLAFSGILISTVFALVIVLTDLPLFFLEVCVSD